MCCRWRATDLNKRQSQLLDPTAGAWTWPRRACILFPPTARTVASAAGPVDADYGSAGSGTSFAAPQVAGTAALVRARFPQLNAEQVQAQIPPGGRYQPLPAAGQRRLPRLPGHRAATRGARRGGAEPARGPHCEQYPPRRPGPRAIFLAIPCGWPLWCATCWGR